MAEKEHWILQFVKWIGKFLSPFQSTIRIQMFLTMFFMFKIIDKMADKGEYDYMVVMLLIVASFVPKLIEKFAPGWFAKLKPHGTDSKT